MPPVRRGQAAGALVLHLHGRGHGEDAEGDQKAAGPARATQAIWTVWKVGDTVYPYNAELSVFKIHFLIFYATPPV